MLHGHKNYIFLKSVDQDLWCDILLDMVERSLKFWKSLTLHGLIQGQGQRARSHSTLLGTCYHTNLTRRLYDNYNRSYGQLCDFYVIDDVIVTSSDVVRPTKLYLWNQWTKTFDLIYYSICLKEVWIFRNVWPWTALFKVKVKGQGQGRIRNSLGHATIWT